MMFGNANFAEWQTGLKPAGDHAERDTVVSIAAATVNFQEGGELPFVALVTNGRSAQRADFLAAADEAKAWSTEQHLAREAELFEFLKGEEMTFYTPDVDACRAHAQKMYLESGLSKDWLESMLERINAL